MFSVKSVLVTSLLLVSAIASAQQQQPQPGRKASAPCRLKPAIYMNAYGQRDYGLELIIGQKVFRTPMQSAQAEVFYTSLVKKGTCIPPKHPLKCSIVNAGGLRRGIEVIHTDGRADAPIVNDMGQTSPEMALSNFFRAGICN